MEDHTRPDQKPGENSENQRSINPSKRVRKTNIRARGYADQVKPCKRVSRSSGNGNTVIGSVDVAIYKRICSQLGRRWQYITAKEISLICGVVLYLQVQGKRTGNKDDILKWLGFRIKHVLKKQIILLERLSDKGMLLRVQYDSGSIDRRGHGYGLTEYGQNFINDLDKEYDKARAWVNDQRRFTDIVIYLDRVKEQLHPRQRALFTPDQIAQLKAIGKA